MLFENQDKLQNNLYAVCLNNMDNTRYLVTE